MKWMLNEPKFGDIIRVNLGSIYHFGIYVSDDEVIQFGLPPTDLNRDASMVFVCVSSIETFLCGKFLEVGVPEKNEKKKIKKPKEIVETARGRIGEGGYHILYNNCEHFVNQCAFGKSACGQVDDLRKMWQSFNMVDVYVSKYPFDVKNKKIYPKERKKEIKSCKNKNVRAEKFFVWKLLENAVDKSLNKNIKDCKIYKKGYKWVCDEFEFSLSHTNDIVAVVVARKPVGIDIEKIDNRFEKIPQSKILCENEIIDTQVDWKYLNKIWTVKEAVFKKYAGENYNPAKISLEKEKHVTKIIQDKENEYYLSLASDDCLFAKFHLDDNLSIKKEKK